MTMGLRSFLLILSVATSTSLMARDFLWYDGTTPVSYHISTSVSTVSSVALDMFADDIRQVTGQLPKRESVDNAAIRIIQLDKADSDTKDMLVREHVPLDKLAASRDAFYIVVASVKGIRQLFVVGSDGRGTAYGILELSRMAGVSPWIWWNDATPRHKNRLVLDDKFTTFQSPSVEYRGIFINDEDWSLQPWSWRTFEPTSEKGRIGARTYREIFRLLLRLRANAIWPAMHESTTPFYFVSGAKEAADSCGIVIGTSHCEPLMCNNVGEWNEKRRGAYNYVTNRDSVISYWTERLKEVSRYENLYTLGMRGIHDGAMQGVKTMTEKVAALQQVINDQRLLLSKYVDSDVTKVPQVFLPYKEVLQVMENGVKVPDDVTLMWCDDNYGYMTRLSDSAQQKRSGGSGVYYHLSYWGRPHDYLWLTTTQPGLIYHEMRRAYDHNARRVWIANVHEPKVASYDLELFLDMAWDIHSVTSHTLKEHLNNWLCREFGAEVGHKLLPAVIEYYHLCGIRKPELMGWNQVELDKSLYNHGWSPVQDSEFSLTEFGSELDSYLNTYKWIKKVVSESEQMIPSDTRDHFFSTIKYPLFCAADMSIKMLEAQRARSIASGKCVPSAGERTDALCKACALSLKAYHEINNLTDYYNDSLAGGKWKYSMCSNPRDLYVFSAPVLPVSLTDADIAKYMLGDTLPSKPVFRHAASDRYVSSDAADYTHGTDLAEPVELLGHSMRAVALPRGGMLTYKFESPYSGDAVLRVAVIPTQPNGKGDIRISVSIDGSCPQIVSYKEKDRSEQWKLNVMRGQRVINTNFHVSRGKHCLTISALDDHVLVDQWMLDFNPARMFYMFPEK